MPSYRKDAIRLTFERESLILSELDETKRLILGEGNHFLTTASGPDFLVIGNTIEAVETRVFPRIGVFHTTLSSHHPWVSFHILYNSWVEFRFSWIMDH